MGHVIPIASRRCRGGYQRLRQSRDSPIRNYLLKRKQIRDTPCEIVTLWVIPQFTIAITKRAHSIGVEKDILAQRGTLSAVDYVKRYPLARYNTKNLRNDKIERETMLSIHTSQLRVFIWANPSDIFASIWFFPTCNERSLMIHLKSNKCVKCKNDKLFRKSKTIITRQSLCRKKMQFVKKKIEDCLLMCA